MKDATIGHGLLRGFRSVSRLSSVGRGCQDERGFYSPAGTLGSTTADKRPASGFGSGTSSAAALVPLTARGRRRNSYHISRVGRRLIGETRISTLPPSLHSLSLFLLPRPIPTLPGRQSRPVTMDHGTSHGSEANGVGSETNVVSGETNGVDSSKKAPAHNAWVGSAGPAAYDFRSRSTSVPLIPLPFYPGDYGRTGTGTDTDGHNN